MNERKKQQLRDLAIANGTFRGDEGQQQRVTCLVQTIPAGRLIMGGVTSQVMDEKFEEDYEALMREIEDGADSQQQEQPPQKKLRFATVPPWRMTGAGMQ